ncbi:MAG: hypothetical protein Q4G64_07540 [bacterium]|nr:hypothetical protein [bacterium]
MHSTPTDRPVSGRGTRQRLAVSLIALTLFASGCSEPPWETPAAAAEAGPSAPSPSSVPSPALPTTDPSAGTTPSPTTDEGEADDGTDAVVVAEEQTLPRSEPEPAPEPSPEPEAPKLPPFQSDLASGTAVHVLDAGTVRAEVSYWSTLSMDQWTPGALKPLNVRVTATGNGSISLVGLRAFLEHYQDGTWEALPQDAVSLPPLPGPAAITTPASTIQAISIGAVPEEATALRITLMLDLADVRGTTSTNFSAVDSLTVTLAQ